MADPARGIAPGRRGAAIARTALALAAIALGVALLLASPGLQAIVLLAGAGLVVVGLVMILAPDPHAADLDTAPDPVRRPGSARTPRWSRIAAGGVAIAAGLAVLLWRTASIRTLVYLLVASLVVHGVHVLITAVRGGADRRAADLLSGAATLVLAGLCLAWPVLAIEMLRIGAGAWLVFVGLRTLVEPLLHRPAPDAFYTPVEPLPGEPGVLLRAETLTAGVPGGADGWRILYTTTDPDGSVVAASGTVVAPAGRGTDALPLLSIAHGTTGIVPRCAPSLSPTPFADGAATALEEMVTVHGWAGVTSDYVGLGTAGPHQYLVGQAEARNVLDASRAAAQIDGLALSSDTVVWGHSQGGHGALWTGQIAGEYAPELTIRGVAGMAPATDLFALAEATKSEVAGKTVSAYIASSWNEVYPQLDLAGHLDPGTAHGVGEIADLCFNEQDVMAALLRGSQIPEQVFPDSVLDGDLGATLRENSPTGPWPAPVLVAQGLADPLIKPAVQQEWVDARCAAGEPIDYRTYPGLNHMTLVAADSPLTPQLVEWTLERWSGQAPTPTC